MEILNMIIGILFLVLIAGLINPSMILRWDKKPTRLKVALYWFVITLLLSFMSPDENSGNTESTLADNTDTTTGITNEDIEPEMTEQEKIDQQKELIKREIESINDGVDFSIYRGTVESLQLELVMFGAWAITIEEGQESEDIEVQKLSKELRSKVERMQKKEFPILRKEYAKVVRDLMWEHDIDIYSSGGSKEKYINLTGGIFASNKNIKDFQGTLSEVLEMFRFNQARYRWYKGDSEYTYYTIYEGKDSDLVKF